MSDIVENFKKVEVSTGYDASATSIVLSAGQGAELPDPSTDGAYNLVWWNSTDYGDPADDPNVEIVRCTAISTDTLTVTRPSAGNNYLDEGSDNTASTKNTGGKTYKMQLAATKKVFDDLRAITLVKNETPGGSINGSNTAFTTAGLFATGTLRVYLNGVRQRSGVGNDYTEDSDLNGFTMATAPATGDILLIDYETSGAVLAYGAASLIYNETPSGTVNGSNTAFDTANNYVAGTIQVFRDGQLMKGGGEDYTETDSNTITFTTAPVTGSVLLVSYQTDISTAGNADLLDGQHGSYYKPLAVDPSFDVYRNTNQTISNTTFTKVEFNAETTDTGGDFDSTTDYDFTVPVGSAGWYIFTTGIRMSGLADTSFMLVSLYKNGSILKRVGGDTVGGTSNPHAGGSAVVKLAEGDVITVYVYHNSGGDESVIGSSAEDSWFTGAYLGS